MEGLVKLVGFFKKIKGVGYHLFSYQPFPVLSFSNCLVCVCILFIFMYTISISIICVSQEKSSLTASHHSPRISAFFARQIKCRGNCMKIHFASALPLQCFCRGWQDFILRASAFTSVKISTRRKLVRLLPLLHISPRIRSIMCTIQFKLLKDYQYTFKIRRHALFVAAYVIIITIRFTYMANNIFTSQRSLLSIWP